MIQRDAMAASASLLTAKLQVDGADALDGDSAMVGHSKNIRSEGRVSLEDRVVDGDMYIGGRAENPIVTKIAVAARLSATGIGGQA